MSKTNQIRIVQAGSELFAFDCIKWPGEVFQYPVVYEAMAMNHDSYPVDLTTWKLIEREQFEWLVKHYSCMVSAIGLDQNDRHQFFCHNHQVYERAGTDFSVLEKEREDLERFPIQPDLHDYDREI